MEPKKKTEEEEEEVTNSSRGGAGISILGEDILQDIFLRLPPPSLIHSLCISKSFLRLLSSPFFRRSYRSRHPSLLGLFFNLPRTRPLFVPTTSRPSLLSSLIDQTDFFPPNLDAGLFHIADSRHGWLLLYDPDSISYHLCHPVTSQWAEIPFPPTHYDAYSHALLMPDPSSSDPLRRHFQVVRAVASSPSRVMVEIFSSGTGDWMTIRPSYSIRSHCFSTMNSVLVDDFLYWLNGEGEILAFNFKNHDFAIIGLPRVLPLYLTKYRCLGMAAGRLCYAYVEEFYLCVWFLKDWFNSEWSLEYRIKLGRIKELDFCGVGPIGFRGGETQVLFLGVSSKIFSFDLLSRELRELYDAGSEASHRCEVTHVFPYEFLDSSGSVTELGGSERL